MTKPVLVVMAAGMGSRYGGLKQIDPVSPQGYLMIDYSIFDALRAGIDRVVFIIKKENEELFRQTIGDRVADYIKVEYAYGTTSSSLPWNARTGILSAQARQLIPPEQRGAIFIKRSG